VPRERSGAGADRPWCRPVEERWLRVLRRRMQLFLRHAAPGSYGGAKELRVLLSVELVRLRLGHTAMRTVMPLMRIMCPLTP